MRQPPREPDLIDLMAKILAGIPALPNAMCRDDAELFSSDEPADIEAAKELCSWCGERQNCADWVASLPPNTVSGVVGGELHPWVQRRGRPPAAS
jgi:hypothetical protein